MAESQRSRTIVLISLITIAASLVVLVGWIFNVPVLQQIIPGFVAMVFNTALCFVLFGAALLLTQYGTGTFKNLAFKDLLKSFKNIHSFYTKLRFFDFCDCTIGNFDS